MSVTPFDSPLMRDLLSDREIAALFTDHAEIRAALLFEGALAKAQGALGVIPEEAAAAIHAQGLRLPVVLHLHGGAQPLHLSPGRSWASVRRTHCWNLDRLRRRGWLGGGVQQATGGQATG